MRQTHLAFLVSSLFLCPSSSLPSQQPPVLFLGYACTPDDPRLSLDPLVIGQVSILTVDSDYPNTIGHLGISVGQAMHHQLGPCRIYLNFQSLLLFMTFFTDGNGDFFLPIAVPNNPALVGLPIVCQATIGWPGGPFLGKFATNGVLGTVGMPQPPLAGCVLIIDEETIDDDHFMVEAAAMARSVKPQWLVNDDRPTEHGNPWLRWCTSFPGDVTILPGGQVDDEGWFALPATLPFAFQDFLDGLVPQRLLDPVPQVMPLRNQDLAALVGATCVAVVYDSDIDMNYVPIKGNLQGERYGLFAFKVLDVVLPGTLPESMSSTSLFDLRVRVLSPTVASPQHLITIRDHEPDSMQIIDATWQAGVLDVYATSNFGPGAFATVSVDGAVAEEPMIPVGEKYFFTKPVVVDLRGRRVTVSTDAGGAHNGIVR